MTTEGRLEIAKELFAIIRPYYRGRVGDTVKFRRNLNSNEVEELLQALHSIVRKVYSETVNL